jgi:hypothetical protein
MSYIDFPVLDFPILELLASFRTDACLGVGQ